MICIQRMLDCFCSLLKEPEPRVILISSVNISNETIETVSKFDLAVCSAADCYSKMHRYKSSQLYYDDMIIDVTSALSHRNILCLSDTYMVNRDVDKKEELEKYYGKSIAHRIETKLSSQAVRLTQADRVDFECIANEIKSYHLPQNRDKPRREYLQLDNNSDFSHLEKQDLIIGKNILCSCTGALSCGGLIREDLQQFMEKICNTLNADNPYSMAILSGNFLFLDNKININKYRASKNHAEKVSASFKFGRYEAMFLPVNINKPGTIEKAYCIYIYDKNYIEVVV